MESTMNGRYHLINGQNSTVKFICHSEDNFEEMLRLLRSVKINCVRDHSNKRAVLIGQSNKLLAVDTLVLAGWEGR